MYKWLILLSFQCFGQSELSKTFREFYKSNPEMERQGIIGDTIYYGYNKYVFQGTMSYPIMVIVGFHNNIAVIQQELFYGTLMDWYIDEWERLGFRKGEVFVDEEGIMYFMFRRKDTHCMIFMKDYVVTAICE